MSAVKVQSTMKIQAALAVFCVTIAASKMLRGDVVQPLESFTDLVHDLKNEFLQADAPAKDVQNHSSAVKATEVTFKYKIHATHHAEMPKNQTLGTAVTKGLRIKSRACDAEMCKLQQQAKCEAKCDMEREAKRQGVQSFAQILNGSGTFKADLEMANTGSLNADGNVWHSWDGLYGDSMLGYVKDCFGYSAGQDPDLTGRQARITTNAGTVKTFEVKHGQERVGLCYAIYYIGTAEEKSTTTCSSYQNLRQNLCPECCESTASDQGCTGGCSP